MTTRNTYLILMAGLFIFVSCNGQTNIKSKTETSKNTLMENYELSLETAHPKAKMLLTEDFYWSPIDETGPFGSDDGSDAFYGFRQWRLTNKTESPVIFLNDLIKSWGYPYFDLNEMSESKISEYISAKTQVDSSGLNDQ